MREALPTRSTLPHGSRTARRTPLPSAGVRGAHRSSRPGGALAKAAIALVLAAVFGPGFGFAFGWSAGTLEAQTPAREPGAPPPPSLAGVPGFVDFHALGVEAPGEVTLRVSLYGPLLRMVAEATRGAEPDFAELVDKLQGIFAQVYEVPAGGREALEAQARQTARQLESRGWQTVVEVREPGGDTSYLQVRTDGERILGLAVMFVEPGGSAGFINVVGDITPEEVGRLGRTFKIDALDRFDEDDLAAPPADDAGDGEQGQQEERP